MILTRARPGVWATFARPGGGGHICAPPANSKTTQRIDKRKKALDRSWQALEKVQRSFLCEVKIEVTRGHQG